MKRNNSSATVPLLLQRKFSNRTSHPKSCYVVEEVSGRTIYTSWDREEALQLADQLVVSGRETRNSLAVRRVACSLISPPVTENGASIPSISQRNTRSSFLCPGKTFPAPGYCIEKFDRTYNMDIGSMVRKKISDHFVVFIGEPGTWDPIRQKYLKIPHIYEIWHPRNESVCPVKNSSFFHYFK